jgi:activating molecule in BECN1-regulated autophagy protein 1
MVVCYGRCIGGEVRVWDVATGACTHCTTLQHAIISLGFHPAGDAMAIASGRSLYLWRMGEHCHAYVELEHDHLLRCVSFLPSGASIIVGIANTYDSRQGSPRLFHLLMWDFDHAMTRTPRRERPRSALSNARCILNRALLYNDGGFDVSADGRLLCSCAELWVPAPPPAPRLDPLPAGGPATRQRTATQVS